MKDVPIKLTPIYSAAERLGAKFIEIAQWRFPETFGPTEAELGSIRSGCGLADLTPQGKIQIEGDRATEAVTLAFKVAPAAIGSHAQTGVGNLYRLRHDQFYLSTPPGGEEEAQAQLTRVIDERKLFVTVTDLTHGLADILLIGPAAPNVLSKVCGLDFHPSVFPDETAKQSSVAKTRQLILRRDLGGFPAYSVIGARSLAAYLWGVFLAAGQEFRMTPIGVGTLKLIEEGRL
jgi:heterotetrameric sarcosine oxidase gamma subunit